MTMNWYEIVIGHLTLGFQLNSAVFGVRMALLGIRQLTISNAERNQHRTKLTNFGSGRKDNRRKNWQRERKLIFYCRKLKITKKRKQVASHHSRESLSFWNHTKDYELHYNLPNSDIHSTLNRNI